MTAAESGPRDGPGLVVNGVSKYYGHFPALRDIQLQIKSGSTVALRSSRMLRTGSIVMETT